jgi:hypothetical protein
MSAESDSPSQILWDAAFPHLEALTALHVDLLRTDASPSARSTENLVSDALGQLRSAFAGAQDGDVVRHPLFYIPLTDVDMAKRLFDYLQEQGLTFHPDDNPRDCVEGLTANEGSELDFRMSEAFLFEWGEYDSPAGYCLAISGYRDDA